VTVAQVLAGAGRTTVVFGSQGLPPEDRAISRAAQMLPESEPVLRLPDGQVLAPETFTLRWGGGTAVFPPLPGEIYHVTLVLPSLPLVPSRVAPENWEVSLLLRPATGELVATLFPKPYTTSSAVAFHHGVTLRVLEVAHSPDETAVRLQLQWNDPAWESHFIRGTELPRLSDDLGHVYMEQMTGSQGDSQIQTVVVGVRQEEGLLPDEPAGHPTLERTMTFAPVSPAARRLTLTMGGFDFGVPAEASFILDMGVDPQVGDAWALDLALDVAVGTARVTGARLVEEEIGLPGETYRQTVLWLDVLPADPDGEIELCGLSLDGATAGFRGGSVGGYRPQSRQIRAGLVVEEGTPIPQGRIDVRVDGATLCLNETWTVTWEVPGTVTQGEATPAPVVLRPVEAVHTQNGLTLRVEKTVLTDRLTGMTVGLVDPPEGVTLSAALRWLWPNTSSEALALIDNRGYHYGPARSVVWAGHQARGPDLTTFDFEALQPLARRLTLHVPAIEITEPTVAVIDVTLPEGAAETSSSDSLPWAVSPPWQVDIPLTLADYRLRLTEAQLVDLNGTILLMLTSEPYPTLERAQRLSGVQLAAVTAPDGRMVDLGTAVSGAKSGEEGEAVQRLHLAFDVVGPRTLSVQPGRYHVEIDGVRVLVLGPWKLSWSLPAP
jgi:hypothetical protein